MSPRRVYVTLENRAGLWLGTEQIRSVNVDLYIGWHVLHDLNMSLLKVTRRR